jgi:hypothetical protein
MAVAAVLLAMVMAWECRGVTESLAADCRTSVFYSSGSDFSLMFPMFRLIRVHRKDSEDKLGHLRYATGAIEWR